MTCCLGGHVKKAASDCPVSGVTGGGCLESKTVKWARLSVGAQEPGRISFNSPVGLVSEGVAEINKKELPSSEVQNLQSCGTLALSGFLYSYQLQ